MKRPNISPGPWLKSGRTVFALTPYTGPDARMKKRLPDGINRFSAQVQQDNSQASGGASAQEIEANTQAIAALPDLLAALENSLPDWHAEDDGTLADGQIAGEISCADMRRIKAALIKAGYTF